MTDEAELVAALHRRKLRTHALNIWFGGDDEASAYGAGCPSEKDPAKWWSAVSEALSVELKGKIMPWQAVRTLWEQQRACEEECAKPPLFAAAAGNEQKPAFVVPPKTGESGQSQKRWSVRECRAWLDWCGVRHDDVFERCELIRRVEASLTESSQSHSSIKGGAKYRPPQPEAIPMQPNSRRPPRSAADEKSCGANSTGRPTETWYSARANASTPWDYCGCSYTGFAHHTTGTDDDRPAERPGAGGYRMPAGAASASPKARAPRAGCDGGRPAATGATGPANGTSDTKQKRNTSDRTGRRHSAGAAFGEEKRDEAWARTVLGVRKTDGAATIKKRYRRLARKWHPDKVVAAASSADNGARVAAATAKFQQIAAAYELLGAANA